jgi:predicted SAM-dependent methyltransferase
LYSSTEYVSLLKRNHFVQHDLGKNIPFADNAVDYVYSSHFLEHIPRESAKRLLTESYRVLKPGGHIRICIPDLNRAVSLYQEGKKEEALELFYVPNAVGQFGRHHYMYDFDMLSALLTGMGFRDVRRRDYQEGAVPDLDKLDNRPEQTLFVEAVK